MSLNKVLLPRRKPGSQAKSARDLGYRVFQSGTMTSITNARDDAHPKSAEWVGTSLLSPVAKLLSIQG